MLVFPEQVEIVRFRVDTESIGTVISERAATLNAAVVVSSLAVENGENARMPEHNQ